MSADPYPLPSQAKEFIQQKTRQCHGESGLSR